MLTRILEPEVMDGSDDARDYDAMDHADVNRRFVDDLLAAGLLRDFDVRWATVGNAHRGIQAQDNLDSTSDFIVSNDQGSSALAEPAAHIDVDDRPPLSILDVGTGTAQIPIELCRRTEHVRVMAFDAAVNMLMLARLNLELASLTHRVQLDQTDAKAMHYADAMFDAVISNSIVHHIAEPRAVFAEMLRVMKPGGLLFVRDLLRPNDETELVTLLQTYATNCNDRQRALFEASLRAALNLSEMQNLVESLGLVRSSIARTSDRHWTLVARC